MVHDTTLNLDFSKWMDIDGGVTMLTDKDIPVDGVPDIQYDWRYYPRDNPSWASPALIMISLSSMMAG